MRWLQVRQAYPDQWLVIEALEAHTVDNQRQLDRIAVIETCRDGKGALRVTNACTRRTHFASSTSCTLGARLWTFVSDIG